MKKLFTMGVLLLSSMALIPGCDRHDSADTNAMPRPQSTPVMRPSDNRAHVMIAKLVLCHTCNFG
jgi:hypothetical protein